ncbi:polysaccharide export outer membrane protein [Mariniphaga anaerophila]|uniref:Polysaccharide export outer membrane protein n=1 Tax=Mariniphaga anaerophila TaxID=1484053 RepID=A0A1M5BMB6_9BACT|nr:polysaccharide biosynthesis/export family protein [Mariniphaga anaerophila]SHF43648.1 polysaccharide export outer membrane protein [Mariniphaga anaerophila]
MKISNSIYLLLVVAFLQNSCSSTKNIQMFQETRDVPHEIYSPPAPPEIRIEPLDNLYISIKTLDEEVNRIFNPSNVGGSGYSSGTSSNFGDPTSQYINGYRVSADSTIVLPILGKITFAGLSIKEAKERLRLRAEEFLREPTVEIKFLNYRINLSGEVRTPGVYYNYEGSLNIYDAISMANGITDYADLREVIVKRQNDNKIYTHKVNLTDNSVYLSEVFYLQPNDLVYIPPDSLKRRRENSDTYGRFLSTISTLIVAVAFFLNL